MARPIRLYVISVFVLAVAQSALFIAFPFAPAIPADQLPVALIVLSILGLLAEVKPVATPYGDRKSVVASAFIAALLLLGPTWAMAVVVASELPYHIQTRQPFPKLVFNCSQYTLAVGLSGVVYLGALSAFGLPRSPLAAATPAGMLAVVTVLGAYYILNSLLVAVVVAMDEKRPLLDFYRESNNSVISVGAGEGVVGIIGAMLWMISPWSVVPLALVVVIIYRGYSLTTSLQMAQRDLLLRMGELQRRTAELELLNEVNEALTRALDLGDLWELLAQQAGRILDTTCFFVALFDDHHNQISVAYAQDEGVRAAGQVAAGGSGLAGWVIANAQPLLIHDFLAERHRYPPTVSVGTERVPVSVLAVPMLLDGRVLGAIAAQTYRPHAYDVEDIRILSAIAGQAAVAVNNAQLRKQAAEAQALKHLNLLKTQFISTVSHELRSPLTPITGYAEMLQMGGFDDAQVQEMAREIHRAAVHLERLVDDILDLSRIESGNLRLAPEVMSVEELIEQTVRDFSASSPAHGISAVIPEPLPTLVADPVRVRQVLSNLVGNAVKYSPDGGDIAIRATVVGSDIQVSVSDHGAGIAPEKLSRLFEMFYRVDSDLTRRVRGTGLGLAISKHIVESQGGQIWVESQLGHGSVFHFSLPVTTGRRGSGAPPAGEPGEPPRVLVSATDWQAEPHV